MSRIRSRNTKPEMLVRKFLFALGFRYSLHNKKLPGKPDIVLQKHKTVILINGCFWHGHKNCKYFKLPQTRTDFWKSKIEGNISRDKKSKRELKKLGYKIITIWECQLKAKKVNSTLSRLLKNLSK